MPAWQRGYRLSAEGWTGCPIGTGDEASEHDGEAAQVPPSNWSGVRAEGICEKPLWTPTRESKALVLTFRRRLDEVNAGCTLLTPVLCQRLVEIRVSTDDTRTSAALLRCRILRVLGIYTNRRIAYSFPTPIIRENTKVPSHWALVVYARRLIYRRR